MRKIISHSLEETQKIAHDWLMEISAAHAAHTNDDRALVVGLSGHLGAGKTAFVKAVAKELGIKEIVTSPTFVLMKIYEIDTDVSLPGKKWKHLIHIDAYRLEKPEEMEALNFERLVADKDNLIMIEWPENVGISPGGEASRLEFGIRGGAYEINWDQNNGSNCV